MTESEYRAVCEHLGHTYDVHKRYYRLHDITVALTKVGKLLESDFGKKAEKVQKKQSKLSSLYRALTNELTFLPYFVNLLLSVFC